MYCTINSRIIAFLLCMCMLVSGIIVNDISIVSSAYAETAVSITKQPSNVTVAEGKTAKVSFTVEGDGLTYTWYFKNAGSSSFSKTSSFTGNTYSITMNADRAGRQVYCVVTDKYGKTAKTNTVTLSMGSALKITKQPSSVTVAEGKTAKVSFTAEGEGLTYTWYYKNANMSSFTKTSTFKSNNYSATMDSSRNGRQVYCVVTDKYGNTAQTNTVTLSMGSALKITKQPSNVAVAEGATAKVSFTAEGDGLTYAWYYKEAGASKFNKTTAFTGNTYAVAMTETRNGRQLYCVITDKYGNTATTNTVTIGMITPLKITKQPESVAAAEGKSAKVSFTAEGDGLTYTWYFKDATSSKFYKTASFTSNSYNTIMTTARAGRQIYCVVTDKYGNTVTTDTVTLNMMTPLAITVQPASVTVPAGKTAAVTVEAVGDGLTYAWYFKNAGASKFTLTTAFKSNIYSLSMDATRDGRQLYCVITDKYGNTVTTDTVTIAMGTPLAITRQPESIKVYEGESAKVTFDATGDGLTYAWYFKDAAASKFYLTTSFTGNSYNTIMTPARNGRQIYCVVTDAYGDSVQTDTVTIGTIVPVTITKQPVSVTADEGKAATVTFIAEGDELIYEWYYRNPGAAKFLKTTAFTGNTYSVPMDESRDGRELYCVVTDKYGNTVQTETVTIWMTVDYSAFEYTIKDGKVTIDKYVGTDSAVKVFAMIEGYPVTAIGESAFKNNDTITSVTLPGSITSIGASAFEDCDKLTSLDIPTGVTTISSSLCKGCDKLTTVTMSNNVTVIGSAAFKDCPVLGTITCK